MANQMSNDDLVWVEYLSLNRGQHKIIGPATRKFLGYRAGGDKFYIPRKDAMQAPNLFRAIERDSMIVRADIEAPSPPAPIVSQPVVVSANEEQNDLDSTRSAIHPEGRPEPVPQHIQGQVEDRFSIFVVPGVTPTIGVQLENMQVASYEDLLTIGEARLMLLNGMSQNRAHTIIEYSTQIVNANKKPEVQNEIPDPGVSNVEADKPVSKRGRASKSAD
jgi:hypothetical protein